MTVPSAITSNFVNILELHYEQNPAGLHVGTEIEDLLRVNELELIEAQASDPKAKFVSASLVRVLNRMIRAYKTGQGIAVNSESTEESKEN